MRNWVAVLMIVGALAGCGEEDSPSQQKASEGSPLEQAHAACLTDVEQTLTSVETEVVPADVIRLEDEGATLIVSTPESNDETVSKLGLSSALCVMGHTGAPASALVSGTLLEYNGIQMEWLSNGAGVHNAGIEAYFRT